MQQANLVWPTKEPGEDLDYQIDATSKIADSADAIISASVTVAPSGTGEMVATQIVVTGSFITVWLSGGGVKGGTVHGATDEFGFQAVENQVHVHDLHATLLHLLGFDHEKFVYRYAGRDFRLTDVHGRVVREILA